MIHAQVEVVEKYKRELVGQEVTGWPGGIEAARTVGAYPWIERQNLARDRVKSVQRNDIADERIPRPRTVGVLPGRCWVEDRICPAGKVKVAAEHFRRRCRFGELSDFLLVQPLIAEEEESLVASVVNLRNVDRATNVRIRLHEEHRHSVRPRWGGG